MTKFKKLFPFVIALTIFFGSSLVVSASPFASGELDGRSVTGRVTIDANGSTARTIISAIPDASSTSVNLTYIYMDLRTNQPVPLNAPGFGSNQIEVSLSRPSGSNFRSFRAFASHTARYSGQSWSADTNIFY